MSTGAGGYVTRAGTPKQAQPVSEKNEPAKLRVCEHLRQRGQSTSKESMKATKGTRLRATARRLTGSVRQVVPLGKGMTPRGQLSRSTNPEWQALS